MLAEEGLIEDQSGDEQKVVDDDGGEPDGTDDHKGSQECSVPECQEQAGGPHE